MEATSGNSQDTGGGMHAPSDRSLRHDQESNSESDINVSFGSDIEITDDSEHSDYYLETEEI